MAFAFSDAVGKAAQECARLATQIRVQIAAVTSIAGCVASVVADELAKNAADAGASDITVTVTGAGEQECVTMTDNGRGFPDEMSIPEAGVTYEDFLAARGGFFASSKGVGSCGGSGMALKCVGLLMTQLGGSLILKRGTAASDKPGAVIELVGPATSVSVDSVSEAWSRLLYANQPTAMSDMDKTVVLMLPCRAATTTGSAAEGSAGSGLSMVGFES